MIALLATTDGRGNFVDLNVHAWQWGVLVALIVVLLILYILQNIVVPNIAQSLLAPTL